MKIFRDVVGFFAVICLLKAGILLLAASWWYPADWTYYMK